MITTKPETLPEITINEAQWGLAHEVEPGSVEAARQKTRQFIGRLALDNCIGIEGATAESSTTSSTLLDSLQAAKTGNQAAKESIRLNAATNVAEMLYKAGHQTRVELDVVDGKLVQSGKSLTDIQANSFRYSNLNAVMRRRTEQELENAHTFEELLGGDVLDTYDAVVFSLSPEDEDTKRKYGFFTETETCSIQLLRKQDGNKVALETALVAGKAHLNAARHDKDSIEMLAKKQGVKIKLQDAEDSLRQILLIPKDDAPNGVCDVVQAYDSALGENLFYGQEAGKNKRPNYQEHAKVCEAKNQSFDVLVASVTKQLLQEADSFTSPSEATKRLHKITEKALVKAAINDDKIDERVFGQESAAYIVQARRETGRGNSNKITELQQKAIETAVASACPMFSGGENGDTALEADSLLALFGKDSYGDLAFRCPRNNCLNIRQTNKLIESCQNCGADVRC